MPKSNKKTLAWVLIVGIPISHLVSAMLTIGVVAVSGSGLATAWPVLGQLIPMAGFDIGMIVAFFMANMSAWPDHFRQKVIGPVWLIAGVGLVAICPGVPAVVAAAIAVGPPLEVEPLVTGSIALSLTLLLPVVAKLFGQEG